ncbi:MAG: phenylacetic acid degradation operon negative regulatory protein PaaX [Acidobacteriia bacterium]|nr:phenylacetic acid degradation operon negative regulatory protein PaaX [Terriglobia bacterium]
MLNRQQTRTRLLIFTLYGDYLLPRKGSAPTGSLIALLGLLGVRNQAARSTLSRMSREGWLKGKRRGRHSRYALTLNARHLLEEGTRRIFEPRRRRWDGRWRVVVYSLPETKRDLREALRRRLSYLGFGALTPGTWVSPHDRQVEVQSLLKDLKAQRYVQYFEGHWRGHISNKELVTRCWNLKELNRQYAMFLRKWVPELEKYEKGVASGNRLSPSECFVHRFWIIHEYSAFPNRDPNLPAELLPKGWRGNEASQVFRKYRRKLTKRANAFVDEILRTANGIKTEIPASH